MICLSREALDNIELQVKEARDVLASFNRRVPALPIRNIAYYFLEEGGKYIGVLVTLSMPGFGYLLWLDDDDSVEACQDNGEFGFFMSKRHPHVWKEVFSNMTLPNVFEGPWYRIYTGYDDYKEKEYATLRG